MVFGFCPMPQNSPVLRVVKNTCPNYVSILAVLPAFQPPMPALVCLSDLLGLGSPCTHLPSNNAVTQQRRAARCHVRAGDPVAGGGALRRLSGKDGGGVDDYLGRGCCSRGLCCVYGRSLRVTRMRERRVVARSRALDSIVVASRPYVFFRACFVSTRRRVYVRGEREKGEGRRGDMHGTSAISNGGW